MRVKEPAVHSRFVGKKEQAFGVHIEPSQGINIRGKTEFSEGSLARPVRGELGQDAVWLVKCNDQWDAFQKKDPTPQTGGGLW